MIVLDASLVVALLDERDSYHVAAASWYRTAHEALVTTPLILAEIDYFARVHIAPPATARYRQDVRAGAYEVEWWDDATDDIIEVADQYQGLGVSLADASLVALAARVGTTSIATFDERHFRAMRPLDGSAAFTLLPADA